ncbi:MAG: IclR family transcriptional regulator [marine bacterium B5-7]|nr:MAG: IclR family transcriptional regulator [marine bacterium B5-7]
MQKNKSRIGTSNAKQSGSLIKALNIIEATVHPLSTPTTAELANALGLAKPTAHRVVSTLRDLRFLQREPGSSQLIEGDRLVSLALNVLAAAARRGPRHGILYALAEKTGETANLGVMATGQVVYVDRVETKWPLGLRFEVGSRVPIHCTALGKMFLSYLPERQRRKYLTTLPLTRYTETTHTDVKTLENDLDQILADGVSFDNCEFMSGVVCLAVPVFGPDSRVIAGVAFSAPEARLTVEDARQHVPALLDAAKKLAVTFDNDPVNKNESAIVKPTTPKPKTTARKKKSTATKK